MFGNFASKFGNGVKNVIGGMILGLLLLPMGVYMQYCSANQMQYHKELKKAVEVKSLQDVKGDSQMIKTEGDYSLSREPYSGMTTSQGDTFSGTYITYDISKYYVKETKRDKKDDNGNVIGTEYTYSWEKGDNLEASDPGMSVTVNSFTNKISDFAQNYIPTATKHFKYSGSRSISGQESSSGEQDGYPSNATEQDYINQNYAIVLSGRVYDAADKDMSVSGIASKNSSTLTPKFKKMPLSPAQSMLAITYGNLTELANSLESQAKTERLIKFIVGSICFMIGFTGLFGPILKLIDLIPFIGDMALGVIYFIMAIVSLLLSVIFYLFFQFFWLLVALAILIPVALIIMNNMKKKTA